MAASTLVGNGLDFGGASVMNNLVSYPHGTLTTYNLTRWQEFQYAYQYRSSQVDAMDAASAQSYRQGNRLRGAWQGLQADMAFYTGPIAATLDLTRSLVQGRSLHPNASDRITSDQMIGIGSLAAGEFAALGRVSGAGVAEGNLLRQTGSGNFIGSADEAYDAIRASTADVEAIAKNTGLKPSNIQKVKDHMFYNEHVLDRYASLGEPTEYGRFYSDLGQAQAWQRLELGTHTVDDIQLLRHETAEAWYMRNVAPGYNAAHNAAQARFPAPRY